MPPWGSLFFLASRKSVAPFLSFAFALLLAIPAFSIDTIWRSADPTKLQKVLYSDFFATHLTGEFSEDANGPQVVSRVGGPDVKFEATLSELNCGDVSTLRWDVQEGFGTKISGVGSVENVGSQTVSPKLTTTYTLSAHTPHGDVVKNLTIVVNTDVMAALEVSPSEVGYKIFGDKIIQSDSVTINWSTSNADHVAIEPFGTVDSSGSRTFRPTPQGPAPFDENIVYSLVASNACGGALTRTVSVHIVGSVEPAPVDRIPAFPAWPQWTARYTLPSGLVIDEKTVNLGQAFDRVTSALKTGEIQEWSTYALGNDGFAIITRLEAIDQDGHAKAGAKRWPAADLNENEHFSITAYLHALFTAQPGYYRVIVIAVTSHPIVTTENNPKPDAAGMTTLLKTGASELPVKYRRMPLSPGTRCEAFIYEFYRSDEDSAPKILDLSTVPPKSQLIGAGLWIAALQK